MSRAGKSATEIDGYVGERIRIRRAEIGLTQEELALVLNISYQQVQKYETGANRISAGRLYEVAQKLGINVGWFFEGASSGGERLPLEHGGHQRSAIELVRNYGEIENQDVRMALNALVKSIAGRDKEG